MQAKRRLSSAPWTMEGWLRLTIPMAQDGAIMRGILKQFMN